MLTSQSNKTYTITLPSSALKAVVEWFDIMAYNNVLANELIELVHERIKSGKPFEKHSYIAEVYSKDIPEQVIQAANPDSFLDSLYNWQDSASEVFKEAAKEKKPKKKMLSV